MSGLMVMGDAEPYGEPRTLAQKMKNRSESNAFPRPISGPHLRRQIVGAEGYPRNGKQSIPVFNISTPSECMTDYHDIVPGFVQFTPSFVGYWHLV